MALAAIITGLVLLVWSADRFVEGAAAVARHAGLPPLLIGMVIVGFGTSAPEMFVSAFAAVQGKPGLALGNAYGSNISNIALILGLTALISPIAVQSQLLRKELPILAAVTFLAAFQYVDGHLSRTDAWVLLLVFAVLMTWAVSQGLRQRADTLGAEVQKELDAHSIPLNRAITWLVLGLVVLIASSQILVWGAVDIAQRFGVADLIIGLTVVALGTSLPELASSVAAARKGEHDIALGNIVGSNLFNTLVVVGIAGVLHPAEVDPQILFRDCGVMGVLTLSLFAMGYRRHGPGRINRWEGTVLLAAYAVYTGVLVATAVAARS